MSEEGWLLTEHVVALENECLLAMISLPDGTMWPVVLDVETENQKITTAEGLIKTAPHEATGPIPRKVKKAMGLICGRPTHEGGPCQHTVRQIGEPCHYHREEDQ